MKKLLYIFTVIFLALLSCQDDVLEQSNGGNSNGNWATVNFSLEIPDFTMKTKAIGDITELSLLTFDANHSFLGRVSANNQTARVLKDTRYIHFIANYDWNTFSENENLGKLETELIPALETSDYVFWARVEVLDFTSPISVTLLRNYAKVTVQSNVSSFTVAGFDVYNFASKGTVATYNEKENGTFEPNDNEVLTLPRSVVYTDGSDSELNNAEKYLFESPNTSEHTTYVIIKNGKNSKYYKVHLLDANKRLYKIERNFNYIVNIKGFTDGAGGASTIEEAKGNAPSNNLYAEILKESPIISDANGNRLEVDKLVHLFTSAGQLRVQADYYVNGTTKNNADMTIEVLEDDNAILSGTPSISNGTITVGIKKVSSGQNTAILRVSKGVLSREIRVIASELYTFEAYTPSITYTGRDAAVDLSFTIPDTYPEELLPVRCKIHATSLYPVEPNKNMLIVYENNTYYYIYEAQSKGIQEVKFKSSLSEQAELVTIENESFATASILVSYKKTSKTISGTLKKATGSESSANLSKGSRFTWILDDGTTGTGNIGNNGSYSFNAIVGNSDVVSITCVENRTNGAVTYVGSFKVSESSSVVLQPSVLYGTTKDFGSNAKLQYRRKRSENWNDYSGTIIADKRNYTVALPSDFTWDGYLRISEGSNASEALLITIWINATDMNMSK